MQVRRNGPLSAMLMLLVATGLCWGAKPGAEAPPLVIKPVNRKGDAFNLLERSKDIGVLFIAPQCLAEDDGASMVALSDHLYQQLHAKDADLGETMAVVVVADPDDLPNLDLKTFVKKAKLGIAVAGLAANDARLAKWKLPRDLKAQFVSTDGGKFEQVLNTPDELRLAMAPEAPPLVIKPVNRKGKAFDIVARSKDKEVAVLFVTLGALTKDDPATMLALCDKMYGLIKEKDAALAETMAVVLVAEEELLEAFELPAFVAKLKLRIAVVGLSPTNKDIVAWDLPKGFKAEFVTTTKGKIDKVIDNPTELKKFLQID